MEARIDEALRFLLLPAAERIGLARQAVQKQILLPTLDDAVMNELKKRGFVELRKTNPTEIPHGASVATDGRGDVAVVEVTFSGRACVQA
jgi:hypothetical protein